MADIPALGATHWYYDVFPASFLSRIYAYSSLLVSLLHSSLLPSPPPDKEKSARKVNSFVLNLGLFTKKVLDLNISRYAIYSIYKVLQIVILSGGVIIARLSVGLAIIRRHNHVPVGPKSLRPLSPDLNVAMNPAFQHLKAMVLLFITSHEVGGANGQRRSA